MKPPELLQLLAEHPLVERLGWTLLHFVWQGALIALAAALLMFCLRRNSAAARYHVGLAALASMAVCPPATFALIDVQVPLSAVAADRVSTPLATPASDHNSGGLRSGTYSQSTPRERSSSQKAPPEYGILDAQEPATEATIDRPLAANFASVWIPYAVAGWLIGVVLLALRLAGGMLRVGRLAVVGVELVEQSLQSTFDRVCRRMAVKLPVKLRRSPLVQVPTVIGWLRPVVLVPSAALTSLTPAELESLLAHELAHVRRYDYLVNLLQSVVETLLFYHPGVWWLSRRIRQEREHCCDDIAAAAVGDRLVYIRALAQLAELGAAPHLAAAANGGELNGRIRRLLGLPPERRSSAGAWLAGVLVMALLCVAIALPLARRTVWADQPEKNRPNAADVRNGDEDDTLLISGRVVDESGKPVGGASVILTIDNREVEVTKAEADERGRFHISLPTKGIQPGYLKISLWAIVGDGRLGARFVRVPSRENLLNVSILLAKSGAEDVLTVFDPAGEPLAGAVVEPVAFEAKSYSRKLPQELRPRLRFTSNRRGVARWPAIYTSTRRFSIDIVSEEFGRQQLRHLHANGRTASVQLRACGSVQGRVVCEAPELARGMKIRVVTYDENTRQVSYLDGVADVTTDDEGRFEIPKIAEGPLGLQPTIDLDQPFRPDIPHELGPAFNPGAVRRTAESVWVKAGERAEVEFALARATPVTASVRVKADASPVAGASIRLADRYLKTDAQGRCTTFALPGKSIESRLLWPRDRTFFATDRWNQHITIPVAGVALEVPPHEVKRTRTVEGKAIDDRGRPIQDVLISASGLSWQSLSSNLTNERGEFSIRIPGIEGEHVEFRLNHSAGVAGRMLDDENLAIEFPADRVALQGIWKVTALKKNGMSQPTDSFKNRRLWIRAENFQFREGDRIVAEYQHFDMDANAKPPRISLIKDATRGTPPEHLHGLYRLRGDELTLCINTKGGVLAKIEPASSVDMYTLQRVPADVKVVDIENRRLRRTLLGPTMLVFIKVPLWEVREYLQQLHGINIEIDEPALAAMKLGRETPVTAEVHGTDLDTALRVVLPPLGLCHEVRGNTIFFTAAEPAAKEERK